MGWVLIKLGRMTSVNWWELLIAYRYLVLAWWKVSVKRERLDQWLLVGVRPTAGSEPDEAQRDTISRRTRLVNLAARFPVRWALCLQRSLALCLWLERSGMPVQLRIGVKKGDDSLEAHAWVEYQGRVLNDRQDIAQRFTLMNANREAPTTGQLSRAMRG